jgi:anti-sigma regulatory factor (Ser/Thr protein kinase)
MPRLDDDARPSVNSVGPVLIAAGTQAPSIARRAAVAALDELGVSCLHEPVTLLVSEIVTNSVVHTSCDHISVTVAVTQDGDRVRVETVDCDGSATPTMSELVRETPGGFGLHIVNAVAQDWGVAELPEGKAVWFEIAVPA